MDAVVTYLRSLRPAKPSVGDLLVSPDGTEREVISRVDHCSGGTSIEITNPNHWVFDAVWFVKFYALKIEKNGENS